MIILCFVAVAMKHDKKLRKICSLSKRRGLCMARWPLLPCGCLPDSSKATVLDDTRTKNQMKKSLRNY